MSNQIEERAAPLEKLLASLLDSPNQLEFGASVLPGRTNFTMRTTAAMAGRLVGYRGAHLRALRLIAQLIGRELGQEWHLKMEDPEDMRREPRKRDEIPEDHDCTDDALMLADLLEALGVSATVDFNGGIAGGFDFYIQPETQEDNAALLDPHEATFEANQPDKTPMNLMQALRLLLKAIGKKSGVTYRVEIV